MCREPRSSHATLQQLCSGRHVAQSAPPVPLGGQRSVSSICRRGGLDQSLAPAEGTPPGVQEKQILFKSLIRCSLLVLKVVSAILGRNINIPIHLSSQSTSCPPHKQAVKKTLLCRQPVLRDHTQKQMGLPTTPNQNK